MIEPGNPAYLKYVRSSCSQKRDGLSSDQFDGAGGDFAERTLNQYGGKAGVESLDEAQPGNPNLIYESKLVDGYEPSGETVSPSAQVMAKVSLLIDASPAGWSGDYAVYWNRNIIDVSLQAGCIVGVTSRGREIHSDLPSLLRRTTTWHTSNQSTIHQTTYIVVPVLCLQRPIVHRS